MEGVSNSLCKQNKNLNFRRGQSTGVIWYSQEKSIFDGGIFKNTFEFRTVMDHDQN